MEKTKIRTIEVADITEAIVAFFGREGEGDPLRGYKVVASRTQINPQQLYYIISGRNDPTLKTVLAILRHYPDEVELRRALSLPVLTQQEAPVNENPEVTRRLQELEAENRRLRERYDKVIDVLLAERSV